MNEQVAETGFREGTSSESQQTNGVSGPAAGVVTSTTAEKAVATDKSFLQQRLVSLDTYRGLIMITLAFTGFGLAGTAAKHLEQNPES